MIETITMCKKCNLCKNQQPLLDDMRVSQVFWVGLSAKMISFNDERPLSPTTNSGKLLQEVEERCSGIITYKTNLVKCVPLDEKEKLRYPNKQEIDLCFSHLESEINEIFPRIVFLLGDKVTNAISRHFSLEFEGWNEFEYSYKKYRGTYFVPIHHPSYVHVYKRRKVDTYINNLSDIIGYLL